MLLRRESIRTQIIHHILQTETRNADASVQHAMQSLLLLPYSPVDHHAALAAITDAHCNMYGFVYGCCSSSILLTDTGLGMLSERSKSDPQTSCRTEMD